MSTDVTTTAELPADNGPRLAIFDAVWELQQADTEPTVDDLFARVIGPLRSLVPREIFNAGEREYVNEKVAVCLADGVLEVGSIPGRVATPAEPNLYIAYPDGEARAYTPGLNPARERLNADNRALRDAGFDVAAVLPHMDHLSSEFKALVDSIKEHGFLAQHEVFKFPDGAVVDGWARIEAAKAAGAEVKWHKRPIDHPDEVRARRRDTPLHRVLLAVDTNAHRLKVEQRAQVLETAAAVAGRPWAEIQADLDLTRRWRSSISPTYVPIFDAREVPYRADSSAKVVVTLERKVGVTSLLRAAGLPSWETSKNIKHYVHLERAQPAITAKRNGQPKVARSQDFAPADRLLVGIKDMVAERKKDKTAWAGPITWLENYLEG